MFKWSGDEEEFGIYRSFGFASFELPIFPEFYNFVTETANNKIKATAELVKKNYIKTTEEGFALFKSGGDTALEHKKISPSTRGGEHSISFYVENPIDYVVRPYTVSDGVYFYGEEYKWVDLGLSVLWAKYNVGATSPEEYGGYYAWGEIEEKTYYGTNNYKYSTLSNDGYWTGSYIGADISGTQYDVAYVQWGEGARMPRITEFEELINNCTYQHTTYKNIVGVWFTGPNGNKLFVPMAGSRFWDEYESQGYDGLYWTSNYYELTSKYASCLELDGGDIGELDIWIYHDRKYIGNSIRPVKDKSYQSK